MKLISRLVRTRESYTKVLTLSVESQHWTGPVLQSPADVGVGVGAVTVTVVVGWPVAVARMLRESTQ